jgi:hypothetical protein
MLDYLPSQFPTVIRLIRDEIIPPGGDDVQPVVIAVTENDGKFVAKLRTDDEKAPNPIARCVLERDPSPWWDQYLAVTGAKPEKPAPKKSTKKKEE